MPAPNQDSAIALDCKVEPQFEPCFHGAKRHSVKVRLSSFADMFFGKPNILVPVVFGDVMLAGSIVVSDRLSDGGVGAGHFRNAAESFGAEKFVDRIGVETGQEFALGVCP